jgi:hypothetical protein
MDAHCVAMQQALPQLEQVLRDNGIERRGSNLRGAEAVIRFRDRVTGEVYTVRISPNPAACK